MLTPEYCETRAEECDALAAECADEAMTREWLRMAAEWRLAGQGENEPAAPDLRLATVDGRPV